MRNIVSAFLTVAVLGSLVACGRNPSVINNGDIQHGHFTLDSITAPVYIAYFTGNGTVSPDCSRLSYYVFSPDGMLNHKCTKWDGTVLIDREISIGDSFFIAVDSFVSTNNFHAIDTSYVNHELVGGSSRAIILHTNLMNKTIGIYGMWADSMPPALWELEEMLNNEIQKVDTIHK
jgi:hypothetical protein